MQNHENKENVKAGELIIFHNHSKSPLRGPVKINMNQLVIEGMLFNDPQSLRGKAHYSTAHKTLLMERNFEYYLQVGSRVRAITSSELFNQGLGMIRKTGHWPPINKVPKIMVRIMYRPVLVKLHKSLNGALYRLEFGAIAIFIGK